MVAGAKAAIEKYGSAKAWYEADADDEFSQFMGYDKVKFTINMPDGQTITERQDAGDGYGGVIDFLKRYSIYNSIVPELEAAKAAHMANLVDEVPTPTNETQPEIDKLLGRLKLDCDYYLKTGAEKHLWAETVEKQIAKINELYEKMPENAYFTREQIDDYEKKMLAIKNGEVENLYHMKRLQLLIMFCLKKKRQHRLFLKAPLYLLHLMNRFHSLKHPLLLKPSLYLIKMSKPKR